MNPTTIATANALSGEKTFRTLTYPVTGQPDLDIMSAVYELVRAECPNAPDVAADVMRYLAMRFDWLHNYAKEMAKQMPAYPPQNYSQMQQATPVFPPGLGSGLGSAFGVDPFSNVCRTP